jgi:hypothetical protein
MPKRNRFFTVSSFEISYAAANERSVKRRYQADRTAGPATSVAKTAGKRLLKNPFFTPVRLNCYFRWIFLSAFRGQFQERANRNEMAERLNMVQVYYCRILQVGNSSIGSV